MQVLCTILMKLHINKDTLHSSYEIFYRSTNDIIIPQYDYNMIILYNASFIWFLKQSREWTHMQLKTGFLCTLGKNSVL